MRISVLFLFFIIFSESSSAASANNVNKLPPIISFLLNSDASLPGSAILPGRVEAEASDVQEGTEIQTTYDDDGVNQLAFIDNGDYSEYQVYVSDSGTYDFSVRASSNNDGGDITVLTDGLSLGSLTVSNTGSWNSFQTVTTSINLEKGNQVLRLAYSGGNRSLFNINWFSVERADSGTTPPVNWTVSNLVELRAAIRLNNQDIVMRPGNYSITELPDDDERYFLVSGNNNTIDLSGVHLSVPVHTNLPEATIYFSGLGNTLIGGTIENTYTSGLTEVVDYVAYNLDRTFFANGAKPHMVIAGNDTTIIDTTMIVRGSFPYGYGSYFGINGNNSHGLDKRGGIQVNSTNTIIDGVDLKMDAFSHGIYIGPGEGAVTDNTIIRNTSVRGNIRLTNDMLSDTASGSLMVLSNFRDNEGQLIPSNDAESLSEDGIRSYNGAGDVFVENSHVSGMRSGIRLWLGEDTRVTNTTSIDNRIANISMNRGGVVNNISANFTYGPALLVDRFEQNQVVDMTLLPSPNAVGDHNIADITRASEIIFRRSDGPIDNNENRVILVTANDATITNYTEYTIQLAQGTQGNIIISAGDVIDNGDNNVSSIDLEL